MTVIVIGIYVVVAVGVGVAVGIAMITCLTIVIMSLHDGEGLSFMISLIWVPVLVCFATGILVLINVINSFEYNLMSYIKVGFCVGFFGMSIYSFPIFFDRKN